MAAASAFRGDDGMLKWIAGGFVIAVQLVTGCAGQGGGYSPPPTMPPPPMASNPPSPASSPPSAYAPPPAYTPPAYTPPANVPAPVYSTQPYIYPARGQSPQQEESDKGQCYGWAVQQTGFDPANPRVAMPPPPSGYAPPQQGSLAGGALEGGLGGGALGAVGGAIGGNPGEGAAIGAAVGGLFGLMRRARLQEEEQQQMRQQQQQQQAYMARQQSALAQGRANYNRAFSACMTARGYTVN